VGQPAPPAGAQPGQWGPGVSWGGQWGQGGHPGYGPGGGWGGYGPGYPAYGYGTVGQQPGDRRRRRRGAIAALLTAGALIVGGAGVGIGVGIGGGSQPVAAAPSTGSSGTSGLGGGGVSGNSGSSGFGFPGGSSSSGGSSVSTSSGSPSDVTAIAKGVDPGLVDINTQLAYQSEEAAGTGMVLTSNGEVLTNNHVIEGETAISVTDLGNGRTYRAKIVGYDRTVDVAVLQLENASGLTTVKLGNSSSVHVGEPIVGIGNAGGVGGTPSVAGGSVTALDRSITASDAGTGTTEHLHDMIETNADIRPGDSGGPLVTAAGKVVGMDTAASTDGSFTFQTPSSSATEGFAIPIDRALGVVKQIEAGRSSSSVHIGATPFLGVEVTTPDDLYSSGGSGFGSGFGGFGGIPGASGTPTTPPTSSGAAIAEVLPGTAAASSGLSQYDIITSIDGQAVTSPGGLTQQMLQTRVGQTVTFGYVTPSGSHATARVTLKAGPPQ
jgi:S1-C subfamily serine protease